MKRLSWFVFFSTIAISCLDQPDCYQLNNNEMIVAFKIIGGGNDTYTSEGITATGTGDVFLKDTTGNTAILPLNPYASEIKYTIPGSFGGGPSVVKYVNLTYKSLIQFVSDDCGERFVFSNIAVDTTDFDDYRVVNTVPTNPESLNLELYRCPRTNILYVDLINDLPIKEIVAPDTVLPYNATLSDVYLPLNLKDTTTTFVFHYLDGAATDSLTVYYKKTPKTLSEKCGQQVFIGTIRKDSTLTNFTTVNVPTDSIYDLPTKINLELTR
jgi:hypothetical protein